jgi:hypothetical protein
MGLWTLLFPPSVAKLKAAGDVDALVALAGKLRDSKTPPDRMVVCELVAALGDVRDSRCAKSLWILTNALIHNPNFLRPGGKWDHDLEQEICRAWGVNGTPEAAVWLVRYASEHTRHLEVSNPAKQAAIDAIVMIGAPAVRPLVECVRDQKGTVTDWAIGNLKKLGKSGIDGFYSVLADRKDGYGVCEAIDALVEVTPEDPRLVDTLLGLLHDPGVDDRHKVAAASALGRLKNSRAIATLEKLVGTARSPEVAAAAGNALANLGQAAPVDELFARFHRASNVVEREDAARALCTMRGPGAVSTLVSALRESCADLEKGELGAYKLVQTFRSGLGNVDPAALKSTLEDLCSGSHLLHWFAMRERSERRCMRCNLLTDSCTSHRFGDRHPVEMTDGYASGVTCSICGFEDVTSGY